MEVRAGIATQYGAEKFDITLDENDLRRLASEYGFYADPAENGCTTLQAYLLLTLEAERFILVQAPKYGRPVDQVRAQIAENREQFAAALTMVTGLSLDETRKRVMPEAAAHE